MSLPPVDPQAKARHDAMCAALRELETILAGFRFAVPVYSEDGAPYMEDVQADLIHAFTEKFAHMSGYDACRAVTVWIAEEHPSLARLFVATPRMQILAWTICPPR